MDSGCKFDRAWQGHCGAAVVAGSEYCPEHDGLVCSSCGAVATGSCDSTMGPAVCGSPLCGDCEHELAPDGTNGMSFRHCRKGAQKYKLWFMQNSQERRVGEYMKLLDSQRHYKEMRQLYGEKADVEIQAGGRLYKIEQRLAELEAEDGSLIELRK